MRLFNPVTMTEVLSTIHNVDGAIKLPDDHWFFLFQEIPDGKILTVNEDGEPVLLDS